MNSNSNNKITTKSKATTPNATKAKGAKKSTTKRKKVDDTMIIMNNTNNKNDDPLIRSFQVFDAILQFLTRSSAQSLIPIATIRKTIPSNNNKNSKSNNKNMKSDDVGNGNGNGDGNCLVPWKHLEIFIKHGVVHIVSSMSSSIMSLSINITIFSTQS